MPGHYKTRCQNPPKATKPKSKGGRPPNTDPWSTNKRLKRQANNMSSKMSATVVGSTSTQQQQTTTHTTTQHLSSQATAADVVPSQASSAQPSTRVSKTRPANLPVKSNAKKRG